MKHKQVKDIKHGERVLQVITQPQTFGSVCSAVSLDKLTVQKVLSDLNKYGYISKDSRGMWIPVGSSHVTETSG